MTISCWNKIASSPWFVVASGLCSVTGFVWFLDDRFHPASPSWVPGLVLGVALFLLTVSVYGSFLWRQHKICTLFETLHQVAHINRNALAELSDFYHVSQPQLGASDQELKRWHRAVHEMLVRHAEELIKAILDLTKDFVARDITLWGAIRLLGSPKRSGSSMYQTVCRCGDHGAYHKQRETTSRGIPENQELAEAIKKRHTQTGSGILVIGKDRPECWPREASVHNERYKDDLSVLVGPLFYWPFPSPKPSAPQLVGMLFINSPTENALQDRHVPMMKFFCDIVSLYINVYVRIANQQMGRPYANKQRNRNS